MSKNVYETLEDISRPALEQAASRLLAAKSRSILLVEDTAPHAAIIRRALDENIWEVEHVTRLSAALTSFHQNPHRIILLDLTLPDAEGLSGLIQLRAINPQAPILIITALEDIRTSVEAMQRGAWDYVVKEAGPDLKEKVSQAVERAWNKRLRNAQSDLIEQSKLAEMLHAERIEAIETIVRTVCHEVNNPLSGVVALSQLLRDKKEQDEEVKRLAEGIFLSAQEVATVVQKLTRIQDSVTQLGGKEIVDIDAPPQK